VTGEGRRCRRGADAAAGSARLLHGPQVRLDGLEAGGYFFFASSSETEVTMITSSPCFQFTGVATWCLA
jgi:hypothetical protein